MTIIIHPNPDLDACTCVALSGANPEDVHFLPAGSKDLPDVCPCCSGLLTGQERILDHPLGEKGKLDVDGTRHAAACSMPEAENADPRLLAEVDEQDSTGKTVNPRFALAEILAAIRTEAWDRNITGSELDRYVVDMMSRILRGINRLHAKRQDARKIIEESNLRIVQFNGFKMAVLPGEGSSPQLGITLNQELDVSGSVFQDGFDIGVTRYPGRTEPDLRKLEKYLSGWFIHSAGFLACWGSRKSPATSPPPVGTPQNQAELLTLMKKIFEKE